MGWKIGGVLSAILAGLAALMCLMLAVTLSDVGKLFGK